MLSKDQILKADDLRFTDIDVSEWGGTLRVRVMSGKERQSFISVAAESKDKVPKGFQERLLVSCIVDEDLKPIFTIEDVEALGKKSAVVLDRVFQVAAELNGLTVQSVDDLKKK